MRYIFVFFGFVFLMLGFVQAEIVFTINPELNNKSISPYIYGRNNVSNWGNSNLTLGRLGGNRWTAYNWENNASNAGTDWYNQNDGYLSQSYIPGEAVRLRVSEAFNANVSMIVTVPIQGYVAADKSGGGDVNQTPDYLNTRFFRSLPIKSQGNLSLNPNTGDNFVYQDEFVNWLETEFFPNGRVATGPTIFYCLDNEPGLWFYTHPRIQLNPVTYSELLSKSISFASSIKTISPNSLVFGFVSYGWNGFVNLQNAPDAGGRDFIEFFLNSMRLEALSSGNRILDVLDLHWYTEARGGGVRVSNPSNNSTEVVAARLQAPRSLWDSEYIEDSWITSYLGNQPINLIPRIKHKINTIYPGTKLAFTEYYYGGGNHISGAIAQADVLGIYGRDGVFAASLWPMGSDNSFIDSAFAIYRNYDGQGSCFGDISVNAVSDNNTLSSIYASKYSDDSGKMAIVLINKSNQDEDAHINIQSTKNFSTAEVFQLTAGTIVPTKLNNIIGIEQNTFSYLMPAYSISIFILQSAPPPL